MGEVRGGEALDMLKAWNTGHPGGIATIHANSARSALYRLEQLIQESVLTVPRQLIAETVDVIVFIQGRGVNRRISHCPGHGHWRRQRLPREHKLTRNAFAPYRKIT